MDAEVLRKLPTIQRFFQISETGEMPEGVRLFLSALQEITIPAGEDIVRYGADCEDGMYIILSGTCNVFSKEGKQINTTMGEGDFIGELGLMNDQPRGATVRAETDVRCANISKKLFEEIGAANKKLYGSFLSMLYHRTTHLMLEQERIRTELSVATRIQDDILEHDFSAFNGLDHVKIYACTRPAKEMGGDFYDVFMVDDTHLCFLIADVSGKGVPAAMFMSMAKIHLKNYTSLGLPLAEVASRTNEQLCYKNKTGMFVTVFLCVLDLVTNELRFINAGHDLPYFRAKDGAFSMLTAKANLVFGMMERARYREQSVTLAPGDSLYLYTDGVNEAVNEQEEILGNRRLEEALNANSALCPEPEAFTNRMYEVIDTYAGAAEQADDITMLYITRCES